MTAFSGSSADVCTTNNCGLGATGASVTGWYEDAVKGTDTADDVDDLVLARN
jgi:hypothetical protein